MNEPLRSANFDLDRGIVELGFDTHAGGRRYRRLPEPHRTAALRWAETQLRGWLEAREPGLSVLRVRLQPGRRRALVSLGETADSPARSLDLEDGSYEDFVGDADLRLRAWQEAVAGGSG